MSSCLSRTHTKLVSKLLKSLVFVLPLLQQNPTSKSTEALHCTYVTFALVPLPQSSPKVSQLIMQEHCNPHSSLAFWNTVWNNRSIYSPPPI